jgi:hypothetical protein
MSEIVDKYLKTLQEEKEELQEIEPTLLAISATSAAFGITNMAFRLYKDYFNKAARKCKDLPPREKGVCMVKAKVDAKKEQLAEIKRKAAQCSKTRKPEKCRGKLSDKIKKLTDEVKFLIQRLQQLSQMQYK